jgi:hypothetical protein
MVKKKSNLEKKMLSNLKMQKALDILLEVSIKKLIESNFLELLKNFIRLFRDEITILDY